jgi:hypothetical protein
MTTIEWYKSLSVQQKVNLKDCAILICGLSWDDMSIFFNMREKLNILHRKLIIEGLI